MFRSATPLDDFIRTRISPSFLQTASAKLEREGLKKIAAAQDTIAQAIGSNENLVVVTPCFATNTGFDGIAVLTSSRILHIRGKRIDKEIPIARFDSTKKMVASNGTFILFIISSDAAPFQAYATESPGSKANQAFWSGTIHLNLSSSDTMNEFARGCDLAYAHAMEG